MPNRFYAVFGICVRKGGTKKKCFVKAMDAVKSKTRRKKRRSRRRG